MDQPQPLVSIIIPTIGRPTLGGLLDSIPNDPAIEVIVVGDSHGHHFDAEILTARNRYLTPHCYWHEHDGGKHAWGHAQRNYGMRAATGTWLIFSQDDNIFAPDAFDLIREAIEKQPYPRPLLFRIMTWQAGIVWKTPRLVLGDIDADCIVVPNIPDKLGHWGDRYNGDFDFIQSTYNLWWGDVAWRPELIATALPGVERHPG